MADNVAITPGSGNTVGADEVTDATLGTVKIQYVKLMDGTIDSTNKLVVNSDGSVNVKLEAQSIEIGKVDQGTAGTLAGAWPVELSDGTNLLGVSAHPVRIDPTGTTPQPVTGTFFQTTQPVSGTFFQATQPISAASLPLPTGASTSALQGTGNSSLSSIDGKTPALGQALSAASVPVVLTSAQLSALVPLTTVSVTGSSVSVSNFPATQPISGTVTVTQATGTNLHVVVDTAPVTAVTGTFFQTTQPVSLATAPTTTVIQPTGTNLHVVVDSAPSTAVTGTVAVSNFPATQPVSGTIAATQSGTWNIGTLTSITNPVAVTGTFFQATQPVSGTVAATQSGTWNVGTVTTITNPVTIVPGTATLAAGAETAVSSTAVQVLAAGTYKGIVLQNTGSANVRVGVSGVTTTTGLRLIPGASVTYSDTAIPSNAIFAIREGTADSIVMAETVA